MDTQTRTDLAVASSSFDALPTANLPATTALQAWVAVEGYDVREVVRRTPTTDVFLTYHRPTGTYRELLVVERVPDVDQGALRATIEAEVAAAHALTHLGIAAVEEVGLTGDGRIFVATARPVGRSLPTLLAEDGRLPVLRAFELGHTLVTALAVAHEREVVHGWITPDSVIIVPPRAGWPERAVVLGLGTAAAQDAGLTVGAFSEAQSHYMSPERAAGESPSARGDVFALGSLLLSMLTGSTPSVVRAAGARAGTIADDSWAPGDIEQVLHRARSADPAARYASASELGTALWTVHNAWFAARHAESATDAAIAPTSTAVGRRRALVAAGVVGVLAAGVTARLWAGRATAELERPLAATSHAPLAAAAATTPSVVPSVTPSLASVAPAPTPLQVADSMAMASYRDRAASARLAAAAATSVAPTPAAATPVAAVGQASRDVALPRAVALTAGRAASAEPRAAGSGPATPPATSPATTAAGATVAAAPATVTAAAGGDVAITSPSATSSAAPAPDAGASDAARGARASEVLAMVAEYGTAIGARDLGRLARVYPAMTDQQRRGWQAFFGSVSDLRAPLTVEHIAVAGATAQVRVRASYEYENLRPHRAERSVVTYKLTLARDTAGWRIRAVE